MTTGSAKQDGEIISKIHQYLSFLGHIYHNVSLEKVHEIRFLKVIPEYLFLCFSQSEEEQEEEVS